MTALGVRGGGAGRSSGLLDMGFAHMRDSLSLIQGNHTASGVVLRRRESPKSQELLLFLSSLGAVWVSAPGAGGPKNRFGAGTEPMMWGEFTLYQSPRRLYLKGVDIREDFWNIRKSPRTLRTAIKWCGEIVSRLLPGAQSDDLLSLLWGCMKNLSCGLDPTLLDIRFAWRWGNLWGLAPQLDSCSSCGAAIDDKSPSALRRTSDGILCGKCSADARILNSVTLCGSLETFTLDLMRRAATLPREKFLSWASNTPSLAALADCPSWLYSFISVK
jgi:DNA repair protein RecO (recombination protein O)